MNLPFEYDQVAIGEFGGTTPSGPALTDFQNARVVILPVPLDRTTSYVPGTRTGPHEILVASSHMELWDEETGTDVHGVGICTLPEMDFPFASMDDVVQDMAITMFAERTDIYGISDTFGDRQMIAPTDQDALIHWRAGRLRWNPEYKPWFYRDVWNILYRPDQYSYLCDVLGQSNYPHNQSTRGTFE